MARISQRALPLATQARHPTLYHPSVFADLRATDVLAAAERIRPTVRRTRLIRSAELTEVARGDVYLKLENEQLTGSFKVRGALNALAALPEEVRRRGVVASSAGNHGMGVAFA